MMKGKRFLRTAALAAVFAAALLTACEQAALPEVLPHTEASVPGMGTVTVRATAAGAVRSREAGAARTVAPDFAEAAFDTYDLTFSGGTTIPAKTVPAEDIGTPIKLPEGDYTLTVTARKGDDPIATGTASVTVKIDEPQTVEVFLSPETGGADGTFSYNVTFRAGTKGVLTLTDTAGNAVKDSAGDTVEPITLTGNKTGTVEKLRPGVYLLAGAITRDSETVNFTNETVYLYSGLESTFTRNFSLALPVKVESLAELLAFLNAADANTAATPYPLNLSGLTLTDLTKDNDPLGQLFASLNSTIYVDLDLSGCNITKIEGTPSSTIANNRPNKDKIVSLTLPESLESIGNYAFYGCSSLTSVDLPAKLTTIGNSVFTNCTKLAAIDLPDSLESLGNSAFQGCSSLTTIVLPESLESLGEYAFRNCSSLATINLPANLTTIESNAFQNCSSLTTIVLPESLESLGEYAFSGCSSLATINLPANLTTIERNAFQDCTSLATINLPANLTTIESATFQTCSSLTTIVLPANLTTIGNNAFQSCSSLTSIDLPASLTSIGGNAFRSCTKLATVISRNTNPPTLGNNAFQYDTTLSSIKVPTSTSVTAYKKTTNWITYEGIITALQ